MAKIARHISGSPPAIRVVSRQPLAAKGSKSFGVASASADAIKCGKWLVAASAWSCSAGVIVDDFGPQALPEPADFHHRRAVGLLGRRDDHLAALEQIAAGKLDARAMVAGERMTAHEPRPVAAIDEQRLHALDDSLLSCCRRR